MKHLGRRLCIVLFAMLVFMPVKVSANGYSIEDLKRWFPQYSEYFDDPNVEITVGGTELLTPAPTPIGQLSETEQQEKNNKARRDGMAYIWSLLDSALSSVIKPDMTTDQKVRAAYDLVIFNSLHVDGAGFSFRKNPYMVNYETQLNYSAYINNNITSDSPGFALRTKLLTGSSDGQGICDDFAGAFAALLGRMEIPVEVWGGYYLNRNGTRLSHAWVRAQVDGQWYMYDPDVDSTVWHRDGKNLHFVYKLADDRSVHAEGAVMIDQDSIKASFVDCPAPFSMDALNKIKAQSVKTPASDVSVYYNGAKINFDSQPFLYWDILYIQTEPLFEAMGITSVFESHEYYQRLFAKRGGIGVQFTGNANYIQQDESPFTKVKEYDASIPAPMLYNDRFYVPVMYISDAFGADFVWDGAARSVRITE
ncbi:MAG: hypothetical protein LBT44_09790 [Clostridiales bacterium]|jgi:hypothetical protein|nr:hypothetical protein [Clostridiales bacterium]